MRLGAPVFDYGNAEEWVQKHIQNGYGAAYWPLEDGDVREAEFLAAAQEYRLVIAEVGAWCNLLDPDPIKREKNQRYCIGQLALAERVGARCCVNISGSLGTQWDGPHPGNLTEATFDRIVSITCRILDEVQPQVSCYALEPMPWMYPTDLDSTLRLIRAIDRKSFGVHADICNMINSAEKAYKTGAITRAYFTALAPYIRSVHAKDTRLSDALTVHIDEAIPGEGIFDYPELLKQCAKLDDVCMMIEHLKTGEEYDRAAAYIKSVASANALEFDQARIS